MRFQTPLIRAILLRRYKRFLSDIRLPDGTEAVAHCPNPGSMMGLTAPGSTIWVEPNSDPKKKLRYGWRLIELPDGHMVGIDAGRANRIVGEALAADLIPELRGYGAIRPEQKYGTNSRIDFLLQSDGQPDCYVEVKNVHLRRETDWAEFPDSVTKRGAKHLRELQQIAASGARAVMLYLVQRDDCARFRLAGDIDPVYASEFDTARQNRVEILCYGTHLSPWEITLAGPLPDDPASQRP